MSTQKQYELVYIVAADATDEQVAELHTLVEGIVSRYSGVIDRTEQMGRRRLAYPIGRHKEGIYVLEVITGSGDVVKELDRRLKVTDQVVRHLIVRVDEDLRIANRARARRQQRTARRRVARGLPAEPTPEEQMQAGAQSVGQDSRVEEAEL
jgi:small subunit ribosomal protein S6